MTATGSELGEVMSLVERILPDPAGYGQKLVQQAIVQWAETSQVQHLTVPGETTGPDALDITTILACALGACDCWGTRADCPLCMGAGGPGWAEPDREFFEQYVGPAAARLGVRWAAGPDGADVAPPPGADAAPPTRADAAPPTRAERPHRAPRRPERPAAPGRQESPAAPEGVNP